MLFLSISVMVNVFRYFQIRVCWFYLWRSMGHAIINQLLLHCLCKLLFGQYLVLASLLQDSIDENFTSAVRPWPRWILPRQHLEMWLASCQKTWPQGNLKLDISVQDSTILMTQYFTVITYSLECFGSWVFLILLLSFLHSFWHFSKKNIFQQQQWSWSTSRPCHIDLSRILLFIL